jgi:hypothetical protein
LVSCAPGRRDHFDGYQLTGHLEHRLLDELRGRRVCVQPDALERPQIAARVQRAPVVLDLEVAVGRAAHDALRALLELDLTAEAGGHQVERLLHRHARQLDLEPHLADGTL